MHLRWLAVWAIVCPPAAISQEPAPAAATTPLGVAATAPPGVAATAPPGVAAVDSGLASWYGHPFHGRQAANGEIYDMETMTAAHPTLPFNSRVRVHNLENGKSVEVRITDRGPFVEGRIIDLSHAAARAIGMIVPGTVPVRVEIVATPQSVDTSDRFAVQVGAFVHRETADRLRGEMQEQFGVARVELLDGEPVLWRVRVGSEASVSDARLLAGRIRQRAGLRNAYVVRN
jgi:rare lipoprotein A